MKEFNLAHIDILWDIDFQQAQVGPGTLNRAGTINLNDVHNQISNILPHCHSAVMTRVCQFKTCYGLTGVKNPLMTAERSWLKSNFLGWASIFTQEVFHTYWQMCIVYGTILTWQQDIKDSHYNWLIADIAITWKTSIENWDQYHSISSLLALWGGRKITAAFQHNLYFTG